MSGQPKKIGGEYGKVRANIDIEKLNAYLAKNIEVIRTPVEVKQFKVRYTWSSDRKTVSHAHE